MRIRIYTALVSLHYSEYGTRIVMPIAHVFFVNEDSPIYLITMTDVFLSKYEEKDHFSARQAPTNLFSNWENEKANCLRIILII